MAIFGLNCRYTLTSLCLVAAIAANVAAAEGLDNAGSKSTVLVEIFEGVPDKANWNFVPTQPNESYTESAFGFASMPTRYSIKAIKIDRAAPFVFRASARVTLPAGQRKILLRARAGSRLLMDGVPLLTTKFPDLNADGHEEVPEIPLPLAPNLRYLQPGHFESITNVACDGKPHLFVLEAMIGNKGRRPDLGELSVSVAKEDDFQLLTPARNLHVPLTDEGWLDYAAKQREQWKLADAQRRQSVGIEESKYWSWRHELARKQVASLPAIAVPKVQKSLAGNNEIDRFLGARLASAKVQPSAVIDDWAFLRRLSLDVVGTIPSPEQIEAFRRDSNKDRRAHAIDELLNDAGWADHWVGYWQDVLAENPGILKPMLNNTGPFRWWIHDSLADNMPFDRFVTELVMMEGSVYYGGPGGFGMATENDVPMAAKAQILAQGFLGMQMQCARCHDAPYHHFKQKDLFSLAAMLKKEPQQVPLSSSIPTNANIVIGRLVNVTLKPGSKVTPDWPFPEVVPADLPEGVLRNVNRSADISVGKTKTIDELADRNVGAPDTREELAALLTDPRNERFAQVVVNRVWKRYFGWGLVEPVDDWETAKPSHPELLAWLGREFIAHDYDLKHIARLILNSQAYQRSVRPDDGSANKPETRLFAAPARRRLSAEQLVDSLFAAVGKKFDAEEMNMDVDCRRPVKDFNNLGTPCRSWEFTSLSNERDRPALSMPKAQQVIDTLTAFGWRESRQSPLSVRDESPNVLQPASIGNGLMGNGRIARLSEDSAITALCLERKPLPELIDAIVLRVLSRPPTKDEKATFVAHLRDSFADRITEASAGSAYKRVARRPVSWSNHLNPEATRIKQELEKEVRAGDLPTERLRPEWRERMEDVVWALINTPEFAFVP